MRKVLLAAALLGFSWACTNNGGNSSAAASSSGETTPASGTSNASYDSLKGSGKFTHVELNPTLDSKMITAGKSVYDLKCSACHKLTSEKLVGPGWLGVTTRRKPEWIMNFVTNTDEMIDKDPHAQAMLQICMVRMPNQHLSDDDARNILEFMRNNDQSK